MNKKNTNQKKHSSYDDFLDKKLTDPDYARNYLNVHLEENTDPLSEELFLLALRQVARAHGFGEIAQTASLGRESLYKALSKKGNPKLSTLIAVLKAMGLRFEIIKDKKKKAS